MPEPPFAALPLERVMFRHCGHCALLALQAAAWRGRVCEIEFQQSITGGVGVRRLLSVTGLDKLERLAFTHGAFTSAEARELIASPLVSRLRSLTITHAPVGGAVAEAIARESAASVLRELHLINSRIAPRQLGELLGAPAAAYLDALSLGGDLIGAPEKFRVLSRAPRLPTIRSLDMSGDAPKEAGLEAFIASPLVGTLRRLDLSRCSLNRDRARLLASASFSDLRVLRLNGNAVGNDGAAALALAPPLAGLRVLELSYSQVGDEGVVAILESPLADGLVLLDLTGSPGSDETKQLLKARMGDRVRT